MFEKEIGHIVLLRVSAYTMVLYFKATLQHYTLMLGDF